ncbi:uncharacterized protein FOMMEDRAFT_25372 [Fomitiporia mediterranea MF3/22]|uniref:uncharacterized protein n=1 Tax=Fomitiporia mediterranea (strain MF3/22) TaxID=694068 RepID=UPI0004408B5F|nr:uncharacterized protein FOMMEDRAFT_25372 [Fomitiporia mediterranea MF3/22]EJD08228.1 hypothetical protein FOMMEDRAFT_25372 [Fomitiporia mediterranea MF3/22]
MPKKLKRTTYEKDNDDHYVVIINPWAKSFDLPRKQTQIDWIGAWLRIAFRKPYEKNVILNIYTMDTRDEVIARLSPSVDVQVGLGLHRWIKFMGYVNVDKIKRETRGKINLADKVSYIFLYNWTLKGDPAERQWTEFFPKQDDLPQNIMINWDYPDPEWTEIPPVDERLRTLVIPIPHPPEPDYEEAPDENLSDTEEPDARSSQPISVNGQHRPPDYEAKPSVDDLLTAVHQEITEDTSSSNDAPQANNPTSSFSPYQPPLQMQSRLRLSQPEETKSGKVDKLDPYEEDAAAQARLASRLKSEIEDTKPNIGNEDLEGTKPVVKSEDGPTVKQGEAYTPSNSLVDTINQYISSTPQNTGGGPKTGPSSKRTFDDGTELNGHSVSAEPSKSRSMKRVKTEAS